MSALCVNHVEFSHFSDSSETVDSRDAWVVVLRDHFWHLKSRVWRVWVGGAQERETGSIESGGVSSVDLESWAGSWDSGILVFHLNARVSYFLLNVTYSV